MNKKEYYENPLISRYSSEEMCRNFSDDKKFTTWRKLWIALAEAEKELGLNINEEQINEMKENINRIDYKLAAEKEKEFRHDVMAHVHTFGIQCPKAMPIIHLGATSAFVGDNTDVIVIRDAVYIIKKKLINLIKSVSDFCMKYRELPTMGFTHFQPAQLTTVGKRASLWLQDLYLDYQQLEFVLSNFKLRGAKGTTGTQASYMKLFNNDNEKVKKLDKLIAEKLNFENVIDLTGQTYTRKIDYYVTSMLSGIAQSLHKTTNDIRLLQSLKEIEEPFAKSQIGSSAMAYKRNPMRSERIASLSRFVISNTSNTSATTSTQWLERTLDDSANRRLVIPQTFLATDAILEIAINIFDGMVVNDKVIEKHINEELPFMATENIIMECVKRGGNRQNLHETIRTLSMESSEQVKKFGKNNDLIERIIKDDNISLSETEINEIMDPQKFIGRSAKQVEEFVNEIINPTIKENENLLGMKIDLKV